MKCLPASKLSESNGVAIHDWHAEVLALRSFNHFVLQECQGLATGNDTSSEFLRRRTRAEISAQSSASDDGGSNTSWHSQPFAWRDDVTLHMYCSEAPCKPARPFTNLASQKLTLPGGDASMELTMAAQDDASPWDIPSPLTTTDSPPSTCPSHTLTAALPGRAYFSQLGVVRRKPARGDAPPTLSKSCSDKITLKQCTSLLSSLPSLLVSPHNVYLTTLILPESQFSETACSRCFSAEGRMRALAGRRWEGGTYRFVPFRVVTTREEFEFSKRAVAARAERTSASNLAVAWTRDGVEEALVGGVLQGRRQFVLKGASAVSRRGMWKLTAEVAGMLDGEEETRIREGLAARTYDEVKGDALLDGRRAVKEEVRRDALTGWIQNTGGGGFTMEA